MVDPSYLDVHKGFIHTSLDLLLDILFIVLGRVRHVFFYLFLVVALLSSPWHTPQRCLYCPGHRKPVSVGVVRLEDTQNLLS
jgi:hypothetical protein